MIDSEPSLALLLESRSAAALLYGISAGLLLWLLALARLRGAVAAAALVAVAFLARGWTAAHLLVGVLIGGGLLDLAHRRRHDPHPTSRPGARDVLAIGLAGTVALVLSVVPGPDDAWLTAASGALATGTGAWALWVSSRAAPDSATRLAWLPDPHGRDDGVATRAPVLAAVAATVVATGAMGAGLLRPGAPAPASLGAVLALAALAVTAGTGGRIAASVLGACLAWALAAFLA